MTRTSVRRLAYRHFERIPDDTLGVQCWAVESLLSLAHDCDEPMLLQTAARLVNPSGVDPRWLEVEVEDLLDRAEAVDASPWGLMRGLYVDRYLAQLERVTKAIRGGAS